MFENSHREYNKQMLKLAKVNVRVSCYVTLLNKYSQHTCVCVFEEYLKPHIYIRQKTNKLSYK